MKNLTIKRQENKTIETNVVYELPAFFQWSTDTFYAIYDEDKIVKVVNSDLKNWALVSTCKLNIVDSELERSTEITQPEFIEAYEKAVQVIEQSSCLVYGRTRYDELQDRESEMIDVEMEVNEARAEFEC